MAFSTNVNDYSKNLDSLLGGYTPARTSFYTGQRGDVNEFLSRYRSTIAGQTPYSAVRERAENEYGVPQLRTTATTLRNTLNQIPYTTSAAAKGFDVNANQQNRMIAQQTSDMAPGVTAAETALSNAELGADKRYQSTLDQQEKELRPFTSEQSMLGEALAREATGFTTEMEAKLNSYLEKMKQGIALSTTEYQEAQAYARQKLQYDQAVKVAEIDAAGKLAVAKANPYSTVGYDSGIYNTQTGKKTGWG